MGKAIISGGAVMVAPVGGTPLSELAVGSTLSLNVNGEAKDFLVVHNGKPSSLYDDSCDGVWLLMKDIYEERYWDEDNVSSYKDSDIHTYLNATFLGLFDNDIQSVIKQVKIPYVNGTGTTGSVVSESNGLSAKVFLLSACEIGGNQSVNSYIPLDGACLSYFSGAPDSKRIAYLNGTAEWWALRSPDMTHTTTICIVNTDGSLTSTFSGYELCMRPALILPSDLLLQADGTIKL